MPFPLAWLPSISASPIVCVPPFCVNVPVPASPMMTVPVTASVLPVPARLIAPVEPASRPTTTLPKTWTYGALVALLNAGGGVPGLLPG